MPYVCRDSSGKIISIASEQDELHTEHQEGMTDEIRAFLDMPDDEMDERKQQLVETDLELIRVIEDLVGLLLSKGVFRFDELPIHAQRKLTNRDSLRQSLSRPIDFDLSQDDDLI